MAVVDFVKGKCNTLAGLKKVVDYVLLEEKTNSELTVGFECSGDHGAFNEMLAVKQAYGKTTGRQYRHFYQSFEPGETSPEIAHEVGKKLCEFAQFKGFQILLATHTDREHIHNHFVLNTVNTEDGHKWQQSKDELQHLKDYSDRLCREYNLSVIEEKDKHKGHQPGSEYNAETEGRSWKYELFLAVRECIRNSQSKEEFIGNMNKLGYGVHWTDKHKYITFTTPEGKKCRNEKLYPKERFTKRAILGQLEQNKQFSEHRKQRAQMNLLLTAVSSISRREDYQTGQKGFYPLTKLEGAALREKMKEQEFGTSAEWDGDEHER